MDSILARADAVREAVASVSTCTPIISASLKELLQTNDINHDTPKPVSKPRTNRATRVPSRTITLSEAQRVREEEGPWTAREKALLATQVINASLKALGEAAKTSSTPSSDARELSKNEPAKPAARKVLRRSISSPAEPLQPRSLNRVSTCPIVPKASRPPSSSGASSTGCLATIECARTAFSALCSLQVSKPLGLPEFQLENGMSSFVNKLIGLNHFEQAARELRILKGRLERMNEDQNGKTAAARARAESNTILRKVSELLDFPKITASGPLLGLIISTQLQALRIILGLKKPSHLEGILPLLREGCPSSPMNLLLMSLKDEHSDQTKCAKQLENLSQILFSLPPSIAPKDDDFATEPMLSPSPEVALEIQALGFAIRLQSWSVSGHRGDVDKDILFPLSKCLAAFARRSPSGKFSVAFSSFSLVWKRVEKLGLRPKESLQSPLATIYQVLATTSRESGNVNEAKKWLGKLKFMANPSEDSAARCCSIAAQLLALSLKQSPQFDENLLKEVMDGIKGSFSGKSVEVDELLASVYLLRKSVMDLIMGKEEGTTSISSATRELFETFIFQLPRFALRWLGKPPGSTKGTKECLRFEQRRGLLSTYLPHMLDSALMVTKLLLDSDRLAWDVMDSTLQDSLAILENIGDLARSGTKANPSASYYVKISHFYYQQHLVLRKSDSKATEVTSLKALRKSIESVKNRSEAEQTRSQLLVKWEKFAELCRATGRLEDALDALRSIRDHLVRQGLVSTITTSLATEPWCAAWQQNPEIELLSRTVCSLAKLDRKHNDWTWLLDGSNKATALEHDLYAIISKDHKYRYESDLSSPTVKALLEVHSIERHPVRRLRTLLQLLAINMDARDGLASLRTEAEAALNGIAEDSLAGDAGLVRYIPHLRALAACMFGLVDSDISSLKIKAALSGWKHMISTCQSAEQLSAYIDSPSQLLTNLRSLADFARIKGFESLHTEILELSMNLSKLTADCNPEVLVTQSIALCIQHLSHGWSSKAKKLLVDNQDLISRPEITKELAVNFHLSAAEYHLSLGVLDKAEQHLCDARDAELALVGKPGARKGNASNRRIATAYAYFLFSTLALERGDCYHALRFAKTAVRKVFLDWSKLDEMRCAADTSMDDLSQSETSEKDTSLHGSCMGKPDFSRPSTGPEFWALAYPLFRFLSQLSSTYAHVGMYQETLYYAEQAQKVARSMESATCVSQSLAWLAWVWLMAGKPEKAMELAAETKTIALTLEPTYQNAKMLCQLSSVCGEINDTEAQVDLLSKAESMLKVLNGEVQSTSTSLPHDLEFGMAELSIKEKPTVKVAVRRTAAVKTTRATSKTAPKKAAPKRANPPVETTVQTRTEETHLSFLRALILQNQSTRLISEHDWTAAVTTLRTAYELSKLPADVSQACFLMGVALIGQSLEQMGHDAVFSVIQDSTLSFPSVAGSFKERERLSLTKTTAPRNRRGVAKSAQNTKSFFDKLREAQGHLLAAHSIASLNGDGALIHRIATVLQNVVILLANTNMSKPAASHPSHATSSVELARNLIWRREGKALHLEATKEKSDWPTFTKNPETRRTSLGLTLDMDCFQRDFVDIIPTSWNVLSVSLSDNENDLCITKLQAGQGPFGIRLPLERAGSKEVDNEVFSFQQGRAELLEIIQVANRTCHDARDMSQKGAKSKWWAEREELDERLKNLMDSIEQTWLGGFKGIFSQHPRRADLLTKFQKSFQGILDKHLPSRNVRGRRGKAAAPATKVSLDPRIYDLFIGLGDPAAHDEGVDEPLTDLLYFVVDILQFHGETNAYDEVDFDAMVVETYGALHSYYVGAKGIRDTDDGGVHTILILDNSLHAFPWESLPCLQGLAVSRVPSLACLRRLIQEIKPADGVIVDKDNDELNGPDAQWDSQRDGHYVSINSGTYILNPSSDLKNTQATFGRALSSLPPAWDGIAMREPSEPEFERALAERDLLLYFGHGSGAQYVRGRTVRKMDKCRAVALLMGCSSASLADVGRFECHGPVWNYMLAGSPAVVGTLWDVTDRDIDRFAGRVFEEWGLMPRGTFAEDASSPSSSNAKGKKVAARGESNGSGSSSRGGSGDRKKTTAATVGDAAGAGQTSLVEAVAKARDACRFRYLTAAAVCVYGIPVYINHQ
ncbi:peptidase family C50-domain-containing protein [Hypoxylon rubiginosum]|uniref:Peptidase family C50-domain-containing protein n=1 Tax=Hypoxylon rubiginosum TaxID=110542 RepID=A0ACB9YQ20_9PEZI|nr:peptidase family C50-domain-containing protein [Hypoxylon rubiginosum]